MGGEEPEGIKSIVFASPRACVLSGNRVAGLMSDVPFSLLRSSTAVLD